MIDTTWVVSYFQIGKKGRERKSETSCTSTPRHIPQHHNYDRIDRDSETRRMYLDTRDRHRFKKYCTLHCPGSPPSSSITFPLRYLSHRGITILGGERIWRCKVKRARCFNSNLVEDPRLPSPVGELYKAAQPRLRALSPCLVNSLPPGRISRASRRPSNPCPTRERRTKRGTIRRMFHELHRT